MFLQYFKLADQPFGATPDPGFLYQGASHREALASLYCALYGNRGFTALIAGPGMGKTTLLFEFLEHIRDRAKTVFLFNTLCEPDDLLSNVLGDLGITPGASNTDKHRQLNELLATEAMAGRRVVLVIDEAQNLSTRALEAVRLLTNFETPRAKLMQIVLAGQPQLANNLSKPEAAQLLQRISTVCHLKPFNPEEVGAYIQHRLKVAGSDGRQLFTSNALGLIGEASHGIPRVINTLCFNSLCLCRARRAKVVEESLVAEAAADLQLTPRGISAPPPPLEPEIKAPEPVIHEVATPEPAIYQDSVSLQRHISPWYAVALVLGVCGALVGFRIWSLRAVGKSNSRLQSPMSESMSAPSAGSARLLTKPLRPLDLVQNLGSNAAAEATASAPVLVKDPVSQTVTVLPGDTLEGIVTNHLGSYDGSILREILELNPRISDPNHIETGRIIRLPARDNAGTF